MCRVIAFWFERFSTMTHTSPTALGAHEQVEVHELPLPVAATLEQPLIAVHVFGDPGICPRTYGAVKNPTFNEPRVDSVKVSATF
jgi:hypothetical protein